MNVLVIRHAIAEERERFARTGKEDGLRPLTRAGRRKMRRAARGIARLVPKLDVIATSPLTRAAQTAQIVANVYRGAEAGPGGGARRRTVDLAAMAPGKPLSAVLNWLEDQPGDATVALVGHEPGVGQLVSWMLTGLRESFVPMKKGAACMLAFEKDVKPGRATLLWAIRPAQLRRLGAC